jgi:predicted nucleic-acid-binding protein
MGEAYAVVSGARTRVLAPPPRILLDLIRVTPTGYSRDEEVVVVVIEALLVTAALVVGGMVGLALVARFRSAR